MQLQRCRVLVIGASGGIGGALGRELRREGCALGAVAHALVGALTRRQGAGHLWREMAITRGSTR